MLKNQNRLTFLMQKVLRGIRDGLVLLPALVEREKIKPALLARWLRHPVFLGALNQMVRELRRRTRLEMDMMAAQATRVLGEMLSGERPRDELLIAVCKAVLEAHDRDRRFQRANRRRRARRVEEPAELCHPDARAEEDELIAVLNAPLDPAQRVRPAELPVLTLKEPQPAT